MKRQQQRLKLKLAQLKTMITFSLQRRAATSTRKQLSHTENREHPNSRIFAYLFCSGYSALRLLCSSHKGFGSTLEKESSSPSKKGHIAQPTESSKFVHACHNLFFWTCSALFFLAIFISSSLALPLLSDADAAGGWYKLGAKVLINFQDIFRPPTRLPSFVDRSRLWPAWNRKSCLSFSWLSRR